MKNWWKHYEKKNDFLFKVKSSIKKMKKKIEIDKVISNNNCVGCGSCVIDDNKNYMKINNIGQYVPRFSKTTNLNNDI